MRLSVEFVMGRVSGRNERKIAASAKGKVGLYLERYETPNKTLQPTAAVLGSTDPVRRFGSDGCSLRHRQAAVAELGR